MTHEADHDIHDEPQHTCPLIDKAIKKLEAASKAMRRYERLDDPDELKGVIRDIESDLFGYSDDVESLLEKVRANAEAIREWGGAWRERAVALKEELDAKESQEKAA